IAICISCKPAPRPVTKSAAAAGPSVRATVVTVRTNVNPPNRTITQTIAIAGDRARDTSEHDVWRLYDVKKQTVTFVDDIEKTIRTESFAELTKRRSATMAGSVAAFHPRPKLTRGGAKKTMQGVDAEQWVISAGTYKRELWIGEHPASPRDLFAMMQASERISSPLAPVMRDVDAALVAAKGFPLIDRSELPVGQAPVIVDRTVVSIVQKDVPESLVTLPRDYRDVTPKKPQ
ncbi:MAG TPA: hypothetical protein VF787_26465, partial [Thermoanaerobaculia bacterium]